MTIFWKVGWLLSWQKYLTSYRVAQYWNTLLWLLPTKTLRLLLILHRVFNWCLVSSTCVLWVTALKILRIIDAYLLCVLNPMVLHCDILHKQYYWHVKKSAISIIAYPCITILAIYWNIAQPYSISFYLSFMSEFKVLKLILEYKNEAS